MSHNHLAIQTVEIISDELFVENDPIPGCTSLELTHKTEYNKEIYITPFCTEHYNDVDLFKLKMLCDKRRIKLTVFGSTNYLPAFSTFADKIVLVDLHAPAQYIMRDVYCHQVSVMHSHDPILIIPLLPNYVDCSIVPNQKNANIIEIAMKEINDEDLENQWASLKIMVRRSTFARFEQLVSKQELPKNIIVAEVKDLPHVRAAIKEELFERPVIGINHLWQQDMIRQFGYDYLAIQILSSMLLNWHFICAGGSARLFSILPAKTIFMSDNSAPHLQRIIRPWAIKRFGQDGAALPILAADYTAPGVMQEAMNESNIRKIEEHTPLTMNVEVVDRN